MISFREGGSFSRTVPSYHWPFFTVLTEGPIESENKFREETRLCNESLNNPIFSVFPSSPSVLRHVAAAFRRRNVRESFNFIIGNERDCLYPEWEENGRIGWNLLCIGGNLVTEPSSTCYRASGEKVTLKILSTELLSRCQFIFTFLTSAAIPTTPISLPIFLLFSFKEPSFRSDIPKSEYLDMFFDDKIVPDSRNSKNTETFPYFLSINRSRIERKRRVSLENQRGRAKLWTNWARCAFHENNGDSRNWSTSLVHPACPANWTHSRRLFSVNNRIVIDAQIVFTGRTVEIMLSVSDARYCDSTKREFSVGR